MRETLWTRVLRHSPAFTQIVVAILTVAAVFYAAQQTRYSRQALESVVRQSVSTGLNDLLRAVANKPDLAKANFQSFRGLPRDKVQALLLANTFLVQFEQMIAARQHVPEGQYELYTNTMRQLFREIPVLHEWMRMTRTSWSKELWEMERKNQPKAAPALTAGPPE